MSVLLALEGVPASASGPGLFVPALARVPQPAEDALPAPRITGISGGLSLFDVELDLPANAGPLTVRWRDADASARVWQGEAELVLLPARTGEDGPDRPRWRARAMLARPNSRAVAVEVRRLSPAGDVLASSPEVNAPTAPDADHATPDWAKGAVWYQIFPERFRNGNPSNDPAPPRDPRVHLKPWTSRWLRIDAAELEAGLARHAADPTAQVFDSRRLGGSFNLILARRYGGDLQGVVEQLDALRDLGVDALYVTPVFRAASSHKYDAADHRHIDETLGDPGAPSRDEPGGPDRPDPADPARWSWTRADLYARDTLIPAVHARGMRIIFDGVWNHVGLDHWAFADVRRRGLASPYADWFNARFVPDPKPAPASPDDGLNFLAPGDLMSWKGWGNRPNGYLPVFRQTKDGDLVAPVKQHVLDVTRRWMTGSDTPGPPPASARGIDGWRLDVAPEIGIPFWSSWRRYVKSLNPDALLMGEVWSPAAKFFGAAGFDGQMNYPFAVAIIGWLGQRPGMTGAALARELERRVLVNHPATDLVQMNLLGSHDTDRLASMLNNPGRAYGGSGTAADATYINTRPPPNVYALALLGVAIQATYLGAPMVYYGDEWGMWGAGDPDCRKVVPWPDLGPMDDPADNADPANRDAYRAWLTLRRDQVLGPVLRFGLVRHVPTSSPDVFAFERRLNGDVVLVVVNRGEVPFDAGALVLPGARNVVTAGADGTQVGPVSARLWATVVSRPIPK